MRTTVIKRGNCRNSVLLLFLLLSGCHLGPKYEPPVAASPEEWKGATYDTGAVETGEWWEIFNDMQLDSLVKQGIEENKDIAQALHRVAEARAIAGIAKSTLYPDVSFNPYYDNVGELIRLYGVPSGMFPGLTTITRVHEQTYKLPISMLYEVDLWGKFRGTYQAFKIYAQAEEEAVKAALLTVSADIASNYFNLRAIDTQLDLISSIIEERKERSKLILDRYHAGVAGYTDWMEAEKGMANSVAEYEDTLKQRVLFENAIAVLLGKSASEVKIPPSPLVSMPPKIPAGLPSAILLQRPDVAQAERTMASFHSWIGVAYSTYFPQMTLTGTLGYSSPDLPQLVQWAGRLWQMGVAIGQVLFNGGRNSSEVDLALAKFQETKSAYEKTVLVAFREVEDALNALEKQDKQIQALRYASHAAREVYVLSTLRYQKGVANCLETLEKKDARLQAKRAWLQVLGAQYQSLVELIKALGGSWECAEQNEVQ